VPADSGKTGGKQSWRRRHWRWRTGRSLCGGSGSRALRFQRTAALLLLRRDIVQAPQPLKVFDIAFELATASSRCMPDT
jgi:hypothetical protein